MGIEMSVKAYMEDKIWYNLGQILLSSRGTDRLVIEGDSLLIINTMKGCGSDNWKIKPYIKETHTLMKGFHEVQVDHIYKKGNRVIDELAKHGHHVKNIVIWNDVRQTPSSNWILVESECRHDETLRSQINQRITYGCNMGSLKEGNSWWIQENLGFSLFSCLFMEGINAFRERRISMDLVRKLPLHKMVGRYYNDDSTLSFHSTHSWHRRKWKEKLPGTCDTSRLCWEAMRYYDISLNLCHYMITISIISTIICEGIQYCSGMSSKELVVDIGKQMGATSDHIEPKAIEDRITNSEAAQTYLKEGSLSSFMEGMGIHDEHVSLQFMESWENKRVNINGVTFEMTKQLITQVSDHALKVSYGVNNRGSQTRLVNRNCFISLKNQFTLGEASQGRTYQILGTLFSIL